jgi:hypothetical protein
MKENKKMMWSEYEKKKKGQKVPNGIMLQMVLFSNQM